MNVRTRNITLGHGWRVDNHAFQNIWPGLMAATNAAVNGSGTVTPTGEVLAGTPVARGPDGRLHPAGLADLLADVSGASIVSVGARVSKAFRIGDLVDVVSPKTRRTMTITGVATTEVITTNVAHGLVVGDIFNVLTLTGGADLVPGAYVVATIPSATTLTLTNGAFSTDISAGTASVVLRDDAVVKVVTDRNVTAVDTTTGMITLSGATFSATSGDLLVKTAAYLPVGILNDSTYGAAYYNNALETSEEDAEVALEGTGRTEMCDGLSATLRRLLRGGEYADPLNPATKITPKFEGFTFRDNLGVS